ncbi:hypothetical protein Tsubulata_015781 [Turnera subulata]|uniref:RING-type domain-containing protein n=1 Tax=Turnera subulata TaxID=218843 RepID=A0A9Q0JD70_9ROSI|nr:hypothetical protein Tsubulata_015781 [Turnera subulata]
MAGMLPGVECARRRRFHQSGDCPNPSTHNLTRRSSFCLYTSNNERVLSLRSMLNKGSEDEKLGEVARGAKERLDERNSNPGRPRGVDRRSMAPGELHTEVFGAKKSGSKRFSWAKLSWKAADQDECTICLEQFNSGETLVHLPCAHRYHPRCLVPWLENNAHCPCCRMEIHVELS